jgi:hypothetical protein
MQKNTEVKPVCSIQEKQKYGVLPYNISGHESVIKQMQNLAFRKFIFLVAAILLVAAQTSCSKSPLVESIQANALEKQFEENILNRNFRVSLATDNGTNLTPQYSGYTFVLLKATLHNGALTAEKNGVTYTGGWSSNDDYSKLTISLPSSPSEFVFLTRDWKFTKKALPVMELAPWGTLEPKVLHMERF